MRLLIALIFLLTPLLAEDTIPKANFYQAKVLRVHDGDTVYAEIKLISKLRVEVGCRFFGVSAPELKESTGIKAKEIVEKYIKAEDNIIVEYLGDDKYAGRIISKIWLFDKETKKYFCLNDELVKNKEIFAKMDKNGKKIK